MTRQRYTKRTFVLEFFMILLCIVFVLPLYYLVTGTLKTQDAILRSPLGLPIPPVFSNYVRAFKMINFFRDFMNSMIITVSAVVVIVIFGSMAAYAIARRKNKLTSFLGVYFLLGFMIPIQTTMVPLYSIMNNLHLINTYQGLIFIHSIGCVFAIFLYRGFIATIPFDLEESARIDGAGLLTIFWRIVFPLLQPITITLIIFNVMWIWNDFMMAYLFLSSTAKATLTLQVYIGVGLYINDWSLMMPVLVISLLPMVIFYLFLQKRIMAGLVSGAIKG